MADKAAVLHRPKISGTASDVASDQPLSKLLHDLIINNEVAGLCPRQSLSLLKLAPFGNVRLKLVED